MIKMNYINNEILSVNPIKIFEQNNKICLYVIDNSAIYTIDKDTKTILQSTGKSYKDIYNKLSCTWSEDKFNKIIQQMIDCEIIKSENSLINNKSIKTNNITGLILLIIQDCNLRCSYCYGDGGEYNNKGIMSFDTAKQSINYLINQSGNEKDLFVTFFGGEPLLRFDFIKELVDYIHTVEKLYNKKFHFSMTCNGTLLNQEITNFILENKISVTISIDGNEEVHNFNRYYSNKSGSYSKVIENSKQLRNSTKVLARATVTNKELNVNNIYSHLYDLGFSTVNIAPCINKISKEEYLTLTDNYISLVHSFSQFIKNKKFKEAKKISSVMKVLSRIHFSSKSNCFCGAGKNMLAVDINGFFYPCQRFVGTKEFIMGSVFNGLNSNDCDKILGSFSIENHTSCNKCWCKNICGGCCPYENFESNSACNIPHKESCNLNKKFIEEIIYAYMNLSDKDKDILFENKGSVLSNEV